MLTSDLRNQRATLSDLAYRRILAAILSHELKPGQRLSPEELASGMKISPTPVKHALARLAGEGLVNQAGGFRSVVSSPSDDEIKELNSCRLMCELFAVHEGISNIDDSFLAKAARILDEWYQAQSELSEDDPESRRRLGRLDAEFHLHLLSLYPNQKMLEWYSQLDVHLRMKYFVILTARQRYKEGLEESRREHRAIYEALERRDAEGTADALRRHITAANAFMREQRRGSQESPLE
jgi:DNA-binding GntR family transcriptional regulator